MKLLGFVVCVATFFLLGCLFGAPEWASFMGALIFTQLCSIELAILRGQRR